MLTADLDLTLELNATAATRIAAFRTNTTQFIRLKFLGSNVSAASRYVQIDGAYRYTSPPAFSAAGQSVLVNMKLEAFYDETGAKALEFSALNGLSAI
jgi:hypothetical protein